MANFTQFKRLEILINLIRKHAYPSKKKLIKLMEEEYEILTTSRTLERDFKLLNLEMGIEISYDYTHKGYFIEKDSEAQLFEFLQFAGRIFLGELFKDSLSSFKELPNRVAPEDYTYYEGVAQMQPILLAIRSHSDIQFTHENFKRNSKTRYRITPLQLREYDRRWYVVGVPENEAQIKTYGLSRISNLKILGISSVRFEDFEHQLEKFNRIVGLNYDAADKAEIIRIIASEKQFKYLKTLPLHKSQKVEKHFPDGSVEISYYLIPNYELKMQLLKMGDQIQVLAPASLRKDIAETLERSLKNYN